MSKQLESAVLAVLFAVGEPLAPSRLAEALETKEEVVRSLLEHLRDTLEAQAGAFQILNLNGQYQLATREEHTGLIRRVMNQRRSVPLSQAALEVLAAVAYNQPVTRAYVEQVRGVDSSSIIASLVEKGLLEEAGVAAGARAEQLTMDELVRLADALAGRLPAVKGKDNNETI